VYVSVLIFVDSAFVVV